MEPPHEEQYSQERNLSSNMSMRDYRNLSWQSQQPVERNPNTYRFMRDYRNPPQMSAPLAYPQYDSTSQPQPPQPISPVEQAILDLTKLVGDVVEEQKKLNAQLSQRIHTVESSLDQKLDGLQSGIDHKIDNLQTSISRLAQQHVHQEEVNPEEECLIDTTVEKQCKQQKQETSPMLTEEGSRKEEIEEPQKSTAQATNGPLPKAPYPEPVYILPAAQPTPKAPTGKATPFSLHALQNFRKLVATAQTFVTTSKKMAATHIAWHSGWFGCWFRFGAPEP